MSGSVIDKTDSNKKNFNSNIDYKYSENCVDIQSIEIACFVLSVCNVVLITEDSFTDPNLFRYSYKESF